jgi:hypothetical protein
MESSLSLITRLALQVEQHRSSGMVHMPNHKYARARCKVHHCPCNALPGSEIDVLA